ncbi:hypothetical protein TB9_17620 [Xanthomonas perforans]|uniref:Uncharacterized protein n=2 Tax=Xanthomonas perforans TaxID=442694 RepID=A0A6L9VX63_XANPE|nr:hypothetical protein [Xanthomonas perforans]KLC07824.1 hypothetical protein XP315_08405 [Xanthomonas perforans]KLC08755.1 hypothetical protein XP420_07055 [Xanthomonas perforans]KLC12734.1 hypothetical protein XP4B_06670 [Xanthomonas perforans]KLC17343.1 hypothetical protein XP712_17340 [Xanthomonas perforans]KLC25526.1 hypothetical protein XP816_04385 [Xanthomonas perforans]
MSTIVNVLDIMNRVALFNGGLVADDLGKCQTALKELFEKSRALSAHLEHSIAIANVSSPETVPVRHPIRVALDEFDEALRAAGGAA